MASVCISNCVNDAIVPIRPTYTNLYKWPESDAQFVKSISSSNTIIPRSESHLPRSAVHSISCRQMYLRSYTFSRNETVPEKTIRCLRKVPSQKDIDTRNIKKSMKVVGKKMIVKCYKEASPAALFSTFRRLLSCTAKVDAADDHPGF